MMYRKPVKEAGEGVREGEKEDSAVEGDQGIENEEGRPAKRPRKVVEEERRKEGKVITPGKEKEGAEGRENEEGSQRKESEDQPRVRSPQLDPRTFTEVSWRIRPPSWPMEEIRKKGR